MSLKAVRISPSRLSAGVLLGFLALWAVEGVGGEVTIWREVTVYGQDIAGQLAQTVTEMKQQLMNPGCNQFSLAYWSEDMPTRLRVEVRCRSWMWNGPADLRGTMGRANHEATAGGPSR